jgi:hypothetical protein
VLSMLGNMPTSQRPCIYMSMVLGDPATYLRNWSCSLPAVHEMLTVQQ